MNTLYFYTVKVLMLFITTCFVGCSTKKLNHNPEYIDLSMYEDKIVYHNFAYKTTLDHKYTREDGIEVVVRWSNEKYYTSSIIEAYPLPSPYMDVKTYRFDGQLMEKGWICRTLDLTLDYSFPRVGKWIEYDNYNEVYKVVNYGKERGRAYKKILTFIEEKGYLEGLTDDGLALISSFFYNDEEEYWGLRIRRTGQNDLFYKFDGRTGKVLEEREHRYNIRANDIRRVKLNETWIEIDSLEYGFPGDSIYKRKRVFSKSDNITLPRFSEGEQAFLQYVRDSVEYPVVSYESGVWGNVQIRFVFSETGKVEDTEFIRNIDAAIYKEVRKAMIYISQIDWIPAFKSNEPIRMTVFLTIKFRIHGYGGYEAWN